MEDFSISQIKYGKNVNIFTERTPLAMDIAKMVGENLKSARKAKNLTQKMIAGELNKKQADYSDYETGKIQLFYEKIIFLCNRLGITPNDLFNIF